MDERLLNRFGGDRISSRQIDEMIGLARGLLADGRLDQGEIEFLQSWLAASLDATENPVTRMLYDRINAVLADGIADAEECAELVDTLTAFSGGRHELGELLKSTTLPIDIPAPTLSFSGVNYCFTGTFVFGQRKHCEQAIIDRGGSVGSVNRKTEILVIGGYATSSWLHSTFGHKIMKAVEMREKGHPIKIVAEAHWASHLRSDPFPGS